MRGLAMTESSNFPRGGSSNSAKLGAAQGNHSERRSRRRAMISAPIRVRKTDVDSSSHADEVSTTLDVSRNGVLFATAQPGYRQDMQLAVTFPYSKAIVEAQAERLGCVTRVEGLGDGRLAVAVAFGPLPSIETADRALNGRQSPSRNNKPLPQLRKPLILLVDADQKASGSLKSYLTTQGYEVVALQSADDAREFLKISAPSLVIAEIEGNDLPGYSLCAHVKSVPELRHIPVVLTTRTAYPTDYANAHSLGAVVCMAKPFQQERMGNIVRLLVCPPVLPSPQANPAAGSR